MIKLGTEVQEAGMAVVTIHVFLAEAESDVSELKININKQGVGIG
jgi:hypothetical protein